jgi:hypothetical protein
MTTGNKEQGQYTHIVLLLDASSSMDHLVDPVVQVVDRLVQEWQQQATALDDMTRLTVYQFSSNNYLPNNSWIECLWYDTDIARIKSLKGRYKPNGATALIDATIHVKDELALTPTMYGDHTFLLYVITDGANNRNEHRAAELQRVLSGLPENWTVAALVPNIHGKIAAQRYGFPSGNTMVWDTTTAQGVEEVGRKVAAATSNYMRSRTNTGMRSTTSLFVGGQVDAAAVKAKLTPLSPSRYDLVPITAREGDASFEKRKKPTKKFPEGEIIGRFIRIDDFVNRVAPPFAIGKGYYQLFSGDARRSEKIQGNKEIAVLEKKTSQLYVGPEARSIVGLPDYDVTVKPDANPDYEIFVRSTSENRHLPIGTKLLLMK